MRISLYMQSITGKEILIGRSTNGSAVESITNGIFECRVISRKHAVIWLTNVDIFVRDLNSSNGTYVNSNQIQAQKPVKLNDGDVVQFGQVSLFINHKYTKDIRTT